MDELFFYIGLAAILALVFILYLIKAGALLCRTSGSEVEEKERFSVQRYIQHSACRGSSLFEFSGSA